MDRRLIALALVWAVGLAASGWAPPDRATWMLEVAPAPIAFAVLWALAPRVRFTGLVLALVGFHGLVLMLGGAYTYAEVPVGFAVRDWLGLARNPYDRFGHFVQGFVPALAFREALIRFSGVRRGVWLVGLTLACCLALSAAYELLEFAVAMTAGDGSQAFLGTQGDEWDAQWDMLSCLIGAVAALALLSRAHDRALAQEAP